MTCHITEADCNWKSINQHQLCRKEKLWPHIREFADRAIAHTRKTSIALSEAGTPCEQYAVHGHYADAGEVAALMSSTLGTDMVMTGHSLGRNKLEHLLGEPAQILDLLDAICRSMMRWVSYLSSSGAAS